MSWTPKLKPTDAARTIPISVEAMGYLLFVPSQARMVYVESHLELGKSSFRSSKAKPLNSRLLNHFKEDTLNGYFQ